MTEETGQSQEDNGSPELITFASQIPDRPPIPFFPDLDTPAGEIKFDAIQNALQNESDRSAAVLAFSMVEWRIRQVIEFRLSNTGELGGDGRPVIDKSKKAEVIKLIGDGEDVVGKFGFIDHARLAYGLNLIGPIVAATYRD